MQLPSVIHKKCWECEPAKTMSGNAVKIAYFLWKPAQFIERKRSINTKNKFKHSNWCHNLLVDIHASPGCLRCRFTYRTSFRGTTLYDKIVWKVCNLYVTLQANTYLHLACWLAYNNRHNNSGPVGVTSFSEKAVYACLPFNCIGSVQIWGLGAQTEAFISFLIFYTKGDFAPGNAHLQITSSFAIMFWNREVFAYFSSEHNISSKNIVLLLKWPFDL